MGQSVSLRIAGRSKITGEKSFVNDHALGMLKFLQDYSHQALLSAIWTTMAFFPAMGVSHLDSKSCLLEKVPPASVRPWESHCISPGMILREGAPGLLNDKMALSFLSALCPTSPWPCFVQWSPGEDRWFCRFSSIADLTFHMGVARSKWGI